MDHIEDSATQVPMISRILQLLMIDILTVGVALRRPAQGSAEAAGVPGAPAPKTLAAAPSEGLPPMPGVSTASPLARMTLHSR